MSADVEATTRMRIAALLRTTDSDAIILLIAASPKDRPITNGELVKRVIWHIADLIEESATGRAAVDVAWDNAVCEALNRVEDVARKLQEPVPA